MRKRKDIGDDEELCSRRRGGPRAYMRLPHRMCIRYAGFRIRCNDSDIKNIDVVVTDMSNQQTWSPKFMVIEYTPCQLPYALKNMKSEEVNFQENLSNAVQAQLCTETLEHTGAIIRRYINKIY